MTIKFKTVSTGIICNTLSIFTIISNSFGSCKTRSGDTLKSLFKNRSVNHWTPKTDGKVEELEVEKK